MEKSAVLSSIPLKRVAPYINWIYFFNAWKLSGRYDGIETLCDCGSCTALWLKGFSVEERPKAEEALKLFRDAQAMLRQMNQSQTLSIQAIYRFLPAHSVLGGIVLCNKGQDILIPTLRQQVAQANDICLSLCDFVSPQADEVGLFAVSVADNSYDEDPYMDLLRQSICDRLVEATSEYLHHKLMKGKGIRPAIGYPSLPDQSLVFLLDKMLNMSQIGISVTENGAMLPHSSVCGLYIRHPQSHYFMVGPISDDQLDDYAAKRGQTKEEIRKWLAKNY